MSFCPSGVREFLPLCGTGVKVSRDGHVGPNASILIPFHPTRYYFSGAVYPNQPLIPQATQRTLDGRRIPGTYTKGYTCSESSGCGA